MSLAVAIYQIFIAGIIISAARTGGKLACVVAAILASIWTLTHVFMPWLMFLQFGTIFLAFIIGMSVAKPAESAQSESDNIKQVGSEIDWEELAAYMQSGETIPKQTKNNAGVIHCPHCRRKTFFKRPATGRWIGTAAGGGIGYFIGSGLGIAGGILSAPVAIPATLVGIGVGAFIGNRTGKSVDDKNARCENCGKSLVL